MPFSMIKRFLQLEAASGVILFLMATLAMVWANSSLAVHYTKFAESLHTFVNEGLMALFFLVVGIELKRGYSAGYFSHLSQILLPLVAAIGGMIIPALIFWSINYPEPTIRGWAIPVATDIAFAIAVLSFFGKRIPQGLKLFLLLLAIFDDIGAIIIIALFYNNEISWPWLVGLLLVCCVLFTLARLKIKYASLYLGLGVVLWICLYNGGIHPTLSGVLLAAFLPNHSQESPLYRIENFLHPWVAYVIMPLFAMVNVGVSLSGFSLDTIFTEKIILGTIAGLFIGKQIGVFGFAFILIKSGLAKLPAKTTWTMFYGVTILCGIGFTMSLFLGNLSFGNDNLALSDVRLGVLIGSLLSGLFGSLILGLAFRHRGVIEVE